ncbi:sacsin-like [Ostrea edulis]|uniref:sacsin-like n=1 Tax=Ostrea edulis TaxID=37623 RepID=UPI0024AF0D8B|nr:sacsin-like [Ostrea edulis]XP_048734805.2 sacsin-like [Ostrea edulis]XP_048734807.2 sacsin-like [Ostrea edulis]
MEGDVDSDSDDEIEYSGMIQPPLIKQLRTILSEYPDDGQILKEIIQNAEDAGASEMKILYDGRRTVQQESTKKAPFRKYFRGPALLVYNNAVFSEEDWQGIKMLYSSIKEFDRTKVGRFGLGFKSVFHITDHPLIISGKQLLVIDPHQDSSKVCQTMQLRKLHKYKKMKVEDCLETFQGVFGFDQSTLDNGHFKGTIFRFPLRENETELSDNTYDESKVNDLFMSFKDEAPVSLLFLKCLESIELLREEKENSLQTSDVGKFHFSVKIDESTVETVRSARTDMRSKMQGLEDTLPSMSIVNKYDMSVCVTDDTHVTTAKTWKVMNLFKGENNMTSHLKKLSCDSSLSYSPLVGVALDMDCPLDLQGHVFCFLPLPLTEKSLSGLPIHINGCFALSQNRRVVKWPTADQIRHHAHTDKSIQWNQALVEEVLSELYSKFILELVEESQRQGSRKEYARIVSRCIPNTENVDEHWQILISPMIDKMRDMPVYFTPHEGGKWILKNQAVFLRTNTIMLRDEGIESTIRRVLDLYHQNTVEVEDYVWNTMKLQGDQEVNPGFINMIMRKSREYTSCSDHDKINLIRYLLSSGNLNNLEGLDLVPLQNGSYTKFSREKTSSIIYMASPEAMAVLVGMEDVLLQALPSDVREMFSDIINKGIYQIRHLHETNFIELLKRTIHTNIGDGPCPVTWTISNSNLDYKWLERVWGLIVDKLPNKLNIVSHLPLIPERRGSDTYHLHILDGTLMLGKLSKNISICLKLLSINVLGTLPEFVLHHSQLHKFIPDTSPVNIINVINRVGQMHGWKEWVAHFNRSASVDLKTEFLQFLSRNRQQLRVFSIQVLKNLAIFRTQTGCVSITQNQRILSQNLPVPYPSSVILTTETDVIYFAKQLGGYVLGETDIFKEILQSTLDQTFYNENDMQTVMDFIIENKIYNRNNELLQLVRRVPFVPTDTNMYKTPSELFDPHDEIVCKIVLNRSMFPSKNVQKKRIKVLTKLGLKSNEMLTATEIYHAAIDIHQSSIEDHVTTADRERQAAVMKVLSNRRTLFDEYVPNKWLKLRSVLMELEIIYPLQNPISPIPNLSWFKSEHFYCKPSDVYHSKYEGLVGYVAPVIPSDVSSKLVEEFGWNRIPNLELVLQQHSKFLEKYAEEYKSEFLLPIKRLYEYLAKLSVSDGNIDIHLEQMWMGDGFVEPSQICIHTSPEDIELRPYLVPLPKDFQTYEMKHLADQLGCKHKQTRETLVAILDSLKEKHEKGPLRTDYILRDIDITIRILNKLKSLPEISTLNISIPIHSADKTRLEFRRAKECNYCNAEWLKDLAEEEGEPMCFVHEDVTSDTAAKLGVPSLTENLLSETEGIQEWGQTEPLTRRIKNLLKDYKDGFAVPKEIVQNADDAKATKVCFLYDERNNMDCRTKLIDEHMESCQGPALWAYNDALFSHTDLENIAKLSGATKAEDLSKVGKFGLGFCSVYNLTDVPSFITGSNMVIFDPHATHLGKAVKKSNPGIKIDLTAAKNKMLLRRMKNQFKPFNDIFDCNLEVENPSFQGTLFRFPLRTKEQAFRSEISDKHYDDLEMKSMIHLFVKNAGNLLLFTQHVKEIEFYHLKKNSNATEKVLLYRLVRNEDSNIKSCKTDVLSTFGSSVMKFRNGLEGEIQQVLHTSLVTISREITSACHAFCKSKEGNFQTKWLISWASGTRESLEMSKSSNIVGALPLAGTALYLQEESGTLECKSLKSVPEGFYKESHIFCYLPLPVSTELPVHINGSFAVSSNRRQLSSKTTDDKNYFENRWNEALLADAVTNAYIYMIESLDSLNIKCTNYLQLWPIISAKKKVSSVDALYNAFYRNIVNEDRKVLCREQKWVSISKSIFLDVKFLISNIERIVEDATIKYMEKNGVTLIRLEKLALESFENVYGSLPEEIQMRIVSVEAFYKNIFLQNINDPFWCDSISSIVLYALDNPDKSILSLMQETQCIPTRPNAALKKPSELVKSTGSLAKLFCNDDERFPGAEFETSARLEVLKSMGMMVSKVREDVLLERIYSVEKIANKCAICSIQRCISILKYAIDNKNQGGNCQNEGKDIAFLPVLSKPPDWMLPWYLEDRESIIFNKKCEKHATESISFALAKPSELYHDRCKNIVGCQKLLLDNSLLRLAFHEQHILTSFGVCSKANIETETVVCQLIQISNGVNPSSLSEDGKQSLKKVCSDIYEFLNNACQAEDIQNINMLQEQPCLLIEDVFVRPNKVALSIPINCSPALYGLDRIPWKSKSSFLRCIGVKTEFEIKDALFALQDMSDKIPGKLDQISLELACNLVELLAKKLKVKSQGEVPAQLRIPNEDGFFSPIHELCLNDSTLMKKGQRLKYPNPNIKEADARILGVQSKVRGSLQDYVRKLQPFGQKEELTNRITRILEQYPQSEGILKEMLQNADDARATDVMFIADLNEYGTEQTFDESWHPLQGPALLVYNNSYFTENDIAGIQHLGRGSKSEDPTKTGQYGVGFNAVYHITDVPSFISKSPNEEDTFCVMDPHCRYAPGASEYSPGARFSDLNDLRAPFADVFKCYHEDKLLDTSGTVFRLPLRTEVFANASNLSQKVVTKEAIENMLDLFKTEMAECLLFLKNVRKISIAYIKDDKLEVRYTSQLTMSEEDKKRKAEFDKYVNEKASSFRENRELYISNEKEVAYEVTLKDTSDKEKKWLLCQRFGFSVGTDIPKSVQEAFEDKTLGLLPQGGIAMPIGHSALSVAKAFCFLPMPCTTGLTIHVNGHFSLDNDSRRGLWKDDKMEYRSQWNYLILTDIIAPLYAKAIEMQLTAMKLVPAGKYHDWQLRIKLKDFHSFFPNLEKVEDRYWKHLTMEVYKSISKLQLKVFLSGHCVDKDQYELQCYPLSENNSNKSPVIFNIEYAEDMNITAISKDLGMCLVDTPEWIWKCLDQSNLQTCQLSPSSMIGFLKSIYCALNCIVQNEVKLDSTSLKKLDNLLTCIQFCKKCKDFETEIDGLPLCLLENGVLIQFSQSSPVILTPYYELLPSSFNKMLHHGLHTNFADDNSSCIISLSIDFFAENLLLDLNYDTYRHKSVQWNPKTAGIPNKKWIENVWSFLHHILRDVKDRQEMLKMIHPILLWSLIPVKQTCGAKRLGKYEDTAQKLFPVENSLHIIDLESFQPDLKAVLQKLNLPLLESHCLPGQHPLRQLIASRNRLSDVLECLYLHKQAISENDALLTDDCDKILEFFAGDLDTLSSSTGRQRCIDMLRALPIYATVYEVRINLLENRNILVLPRDIPPNGMNAWADKSQIVLLRHNDRLGGIYELFKVTEQSLYELYGIHIFPTFHNIPKDDRIIHLTFIKDELLKTSGEYTNEQKQLIRGLKLLTFVPTWNGKTETASGFFDPQNDIMKEMLHCEKFPPEPFSSKHWNTFMKLAGMVSVIDPTLFIEFAKKLEEAGRNGLSSEIEKKSKVLVEHLLQSKNLHDDACLRTIGKIKFVYPYAVHDFYCNIASPPKDNENALVAYDRSVSWTFEAVVWTKHSIVADWATPITMLIENKHELLFHLGLQEPSIETVIEHIKTVCLTLSKVSEPDLHSLGIENLSALMVKFYGFLDDKLESPQLEKLRFIPFVFVARIPKLFQCDRFTLSLSKAHKLAPYAMPLPEKYYGHFALFETLGSSQEVSYKTYADVLERIFIEANDDLHANEIQAAQTAMGMFFSLIPSDADTKPVDINIKKLYFLSCNNKLEESRKLIYPDSENLEDVITKSDKQFNVLASLSDMDRKSVSKKLQKLPKDFRPLLLSEAILTDCNLQELREVDIDLSSAATIFLTSPAFIHGILRIVCKERAIAKEEIPNEEVIKIHQRLASISIKIVENLETVYIYEGKVIYRESRFSYDKFNVNNEYLQCAIYFRKDMETTDVSDWIQFRAYTIAGIIQRFIDCQLPNTSTLIPMMCKYIHNPNEIEMLLNENNIPRLDTKFTATSNTLPTPGALVEEKWYNILDNRCLTFDQDDYVAVLIGVDCRGNREFIYAVIKDTIQFSNGADHASDMYREYLVQVAPNKMQKIKAFDLYRFNRSLQSEASNHTISRPPVDNRSLDDIFKEIERTLRRAWSESFPEEQRKNICRRLMFQWHPDKNPDDVKRSTEVFQFISNTIQALKDEEESCRLKESIPRPRPNDDDIFDDIRRVINRDNNIHKKPLNKDSRPSEANRWLEQAKHDMIFAVQARVCDGHFNWICYVCHQAAEKALKGWQYYDDAGKVLTSENLYDLVRCCPEDLKRPAMELQDVTSSTRRMRYPENRHKPCNAYTRENAEKAIELASAIVDRVDELI